MDLIDTYRIFHPTVAEHTFFSSAHRTFRLDHMIGHKRNLSKLKKTEIISAIFCDHNWYETRSPQQEEDEKIYTHVESKHTSKQPLCQRRNQKGNKKYLKTNENENTTYQISWHAAKADLGGKFIAINTLRC